MVIVKLKGGLGNQLFQYAFGMEVTSVLNAEICFDLTAFETTEGTDTPRSYELNPYVQSVRILTTNQLKEVGIVRSERFRKLLVKINARYKGFSYFSERNYRLELLGKASGKVYLDGYWQKEQYFPTVKEKFRKIILNYRSRNSYANFIANRIAGCNAVALHVRRGDYITNHAAASYHALCSVDYYKSAMAHFTRNTLAPNFFIFTDDPKWAQENLCSGTNTILVSGTGNLNHHDELSLMASCNSNIIANSSYSWWGAWLNNNSNKIVIAPKVWHKYGDGSETGGLLHKDWVTI